MSKWNRFKEGIKNLSPEQQLHSKMVGQIGNIVGIIFGSVFLCIYGYWYFIIFMGFTAFISFIDFIGTRQQWLEMKRINEALKQINEANNDKVLPQ